MKGKAALFVVNAAEVGKLAVENASELIIRYLDAVNPSTLGREEFEYIDQQGNRRAKAPDREIWYAARAKALLKLQRYGECMACCDEALRELRGFHYSNDSWLRYRKAKCLLALGKPDDAKRCISEAQARGAHHWCHLMIPVVTDPKKASGALHWAVAEMTERYEKFAEANVREINGYNAKVDSIEVPEGQERPQKMPQIVIIVDELADLMMVASNDVEEAICRLAQLARAAGIHLVIATQRPSVNVITGLIKANMPSRIAFSVTSGTDSRTILDMNGAEKLLGKGDMLFHPQGAPKPIRVQGAFVSDKEVSDVVEFIKEQNETASYNEEIVQKVDSMQASSGGTTVSISDADAQDDGRDAYFDEAAQIIVDKEKASIGMLQRYLKVGFNRAARIMDQLEEAGIVGPEEGTKPRKVLMTSEELQAVKEDL